MVDLRNEAINRLIELNYNVKTAPHIVDSVLEVVARHAKESQNPLIINGPLKINVALKEVYYNSVKFDLAKKEYQILELLARNAGHLLSHKEILETIWGQGFGDRLEYLRVHICDIRKKLGPDIIKSRNTHGYYIERIVNP